MSLPRGLKSDNIVYFIPYTKDIPKIRRGRITDDYNGKLFIAYNTEKESFLADDGEWYICKEDELKNPETKIIIFNLLQKIKAEEERKQIKEILE